MKVLIIGGTAAQDSASAKLTKELFSEVSSGSEVYYSFFDKLYIDISSNGLIVIDTNNNLTIDDYSMVIFRGKVRSYADMAYVLSIICGQKGIIVKNSYARYVSFSKLAQSLSFYTLGLPFAQTLYCQDKQFFKDKTTNELGYPVIVKDNFGSHGNHNHLIVDNESLDRLIDQNKSVDFIAQAYVPNEGDYRILVAGSNALYIYREAVAGSHLNNTSQGAQASLHNANQLPGIIREGAFLVAKQYDCDIAGVDVLKSNDGQYYFLEINTQPQLATGAFLPEKKALLQEFMSSL